MFKDAWLNTADFAKQVARQRVEHMEFLKHIGIVK